MKRITRREFCALASGATAGMLLSKASLLHADPLPMDAWTPTDAPNTPIGHARGIFPGRVTFIRDPKVARWDGKTGFWWHEGRIDEEALGGMISKSLRGLTGAPTDKGAWEKLFTHFNETNRGLKRSWQPGETIAIKINVNNTLHYEDAGNNIDQSNTFNSRLYIIWSFKP